MPPKFAGKLERRTKRGRGRTAIESTPIAIRSTIALPARLEDRIRTKLARRIGHAAPLVERGTVRFEDVNGPRGGVDTVCRIKLVVSGRPSVQAQDRASDVEPAFDLASHKVQRALERMRGKHGLSTGIRDRSKGASVRAAAPPRTTTSSTARRAHARPAPTPGMMKLETARRPPSRKSTQVKARQAKQRHGVQRGARRR